MNEDDFKGFSEILDGLTEYYQKKEPLSDMAVTLYFDALSPYSISDITKAITLHIRDPKAGQFYPKVGELIKHMDGGEITVDIIVAAAKLRDTPLGCSAHVIIGTWNLDNLDSYALRQLAHQCLPKIQEWRQGEFDDHEISVMIKHNVNPAGPLLKGIRTVPGNGAELLERGARIEKTPKHLLNLQAPYQPIDNELPAADVMKYLQSGGNSNEDGDIKI